LDIYWNILKKHGPINVKFTYSESLFYINAMIVSDYALERTKIDQKIFEIKNFNV
jgi:hypothetical protein